MQQQDDQRQAQGPNRDPKRSRQQVEKRICKYYAEGTCRKGNYCDFAHVRGDVGGVEEQSRERRSGMAASAGQRRGFAGSAQRSPFGALKDLSRRTSLRSDEEVGWVSELDDPA